MTPEIIDHRATLFIPALRAVAYAVEVARYERIHTVFMAEIDKVVDVAVDLLSKSAPSDAV